MTRHEEERREEAARQLNDGGDQGFCVHCDYNPCMCGARIYRGTPEGLQHYRRKIADDDWFWENNPNLTDEDRGR